MADKIDTGTDELLCAVHARVATLTLNRPEARNSLSDALSPALREMMLLLGSNDDVGAIVITGAGTAFCSGGNFKEMGSESTSGVKTPQERVDQLKERQRALTGRIVHAPKPTIAVLPGPAAGAGLSIALACDVRIASLEAFVTTAYANIGLSGDYGMSWLLSRLIGIGRAHDLMFTAQRVEAEAALAMGLFNYVVATEELSAFSSSYAERLANGPTAAFSAMKDNLAFASTHAFLESLDREAENMIKTAGSDDHKEAIGRFLTSRKK